MARIAKECEYLDFRNKRRIIDAIKEGRIKG
jgi:hypothetical protein